ncbi:aspartate/glutamate racemase family protein [Leisingera sp. XS_AS12]|uniref:aspartate/glutamate racemase family protein n=1 Tax=Leisingera sp. XS_AS12 TaxID=3241294 RepID=UPI003512B08D
MKAEDILPRSERRRIGLIAGSGPEAGVDLWQKVIEETKALLGERYTGDLDGPRVRIISSPVLGLSMELEANDLAVWPELERVFDDLAAQSDVIGIACNTLNYYERQIKATPRAAQLISVGDVVEDYLKRRGLTSVALLGAAPVTKMDRWSAYHRLAEAFEVETPKDPGQLHQIIYDVKRLGGTDPAVAAQFQELIGTLESETVLLACTELPLIPCDGTGKDLVDVTRLLARGLVDRAVLAQN